jgi:hypothetical protein
MYLRTYRVSIFVGFLTVGLCYAPQIRADSCPAGMICIPKKKESPPLQQNSEPSRRRPETQGVQQQPGSPPVWPSPQGNNRILGTLPEERILSNRSPEKYRQYQEQIGQGATPREVRRLMFGTSETLRALQNMNQPGAGAPSSSVGYEGARARQGARSDPNSPAAPRFFREGPSSARGGFVWTPPEIAQNIVNEIGSIPEGLTLKGTVNSLDAPTSLRFNPSLNAFVLDERATYFSPISPEAAGALLRAINQKDVVGVSWGNSVIGFGELSVDSDVARDLLLVDQFLANIVFATPRWTRGYVFANGFKPKMDIGDEQDISVYFDFEFGLRNDGGEIKPGSAILSVRLFKTTKAPAANGGALPDLEALRTGRGIPREFQENAEHVGRNVGYYMQEKLVDLVASYGQFSAFARALKAAGWDLEQIAGQIAGPTRVPIRFWPAPSSSSLRSALDHSAQRKHSLASMNFLRAAMEADNQGKQKNATYARKLRLEEEWRLYLQTIQQENDYRHWSGRPYDLYFRWINSPVSLDSRKQARSIWEHNDSLLYLIQDGQYVDFYYERPKQAVADTGVQQGTLLFTGEKSGGGYTGEAFVFRRGCPPASYEVSGQVSNEGRTLTLSGTAPRRDASCHIVERHEDVLIFNFQQRL